MPMTLIAIPAVTLLLVGSPMLERSKGRRQTKRDPPLPCGEEGPSKAKGDNPDRKSWSSKHGWGLDGSPEPE
jgi:hypothetical protein